MSCLSFSFFDMSKQILYLKCSFFLLSRFPSPKESSSVLTVRVPAEGLNQSQSGAFVPKVSDGLPQRAQHPSPV